MKKESIIKIIMWIPVIGFMFCVGNIFLILIRKTNKDWIFNNMYTNIINGSYQGVCVSAVIMYLTSLAVN